MRHGANALADEDPTHLLFITGDIPLITPQGLEDYLTASLRSGAALTYPVIPREVSEARFPGARRTYVRLREGSFTGGNAIFTAANLLDDRGALIQGLYSARKHPIKLAKILGLGTVLRLLTGTITLPYIEAVATRILGAPARAIVSQYAEIGFDVDKLDDLVAIERALAGKTG
jgi:CTP:molybdopterin cytidylyltransferase MocA